MKRACLVAHSYFLGDPRARRQAEALIDAGWSLDIVCLRGPGEAAREERAGAVVHRLPVRRHRGRGLTVYLTEYLAFFLLASVRVALLHARRRFQLVQAHNIPDFLIFTAALPRLLGARAILDIRDPVPDLYLSKFGGSPGHPVVRVARWIERASTAFADHIVTVNEPSRRRLVQRGVPAEKVSVVLNSADPGLFDPTTGARARRPGDGFALMYHGGLFRRYGVDVAIRAVDRLRHELPDLRLFVYGEGEATGDLARLVADLGLGDRVRLAGHLPLEAMPGAIASADLGIVPYRRDTFTDLIYPTKGFEYIAMGVPVVMSRLLGPLELFGDVPDMFVEPEDVDGLARRIAALASDPERRRRLRDATRDAYRPCAWDAQRQRYLELVDSLVAHRDASSTEDPPAAHWGVTPGR